MCFPLNTVPAVSSTGMKKPWAKMRVLQADDPSANPTSTCVGRAGRPSAAAVLPVRTGWWPVKCPWRAGAQGARGASPQLLPPEPARRAEGIHAASQQSWQLPATVQDHFVFSFYHSALRESGQACRAGELCGDPSPCLPLPLLGGTLVSESERSDASSSSDLRLPAPLGCS